MKKIDELRLVQLISLKCLQDTAQACEELDVKYFLVAGTLLGAIRHKGFIPWDSDIDIGMLRGDYDRFVKHAPKLLEAKYFIQNDDSDKNNKTFFTKIRTKGTRFIEKGNLSTGDSDGIYVDVFPIDDIGLIPGKMKYFFARAIRILTRLKAFKCGKRYSASFKNSVLSRLLYGLLFWLPLRLINLIVEKYIRRDNNQGHNLVTNYNSKYGIHRQTMDKSIYDDSTTLAFEGIDFSAPQKYEKWLNKIYGNYMDLPKNIPNRSDVLSSYQVDFGVYSSCLDMNESEVRNRLELEG